MHVFTPGKGPFFRKKCHFLNIFFKTWCSFPIREPTGTFKKGLDRARCSCSGQVPPPPLIVLVATSDNKAVQLSYPNTIARVCLFVSVAGCQPLRKQVIMVESPRLVWWCHPPTSARVCIEKSPPDAAGHALESASILLQIHFQIRGRD